MKYMHVKLNKNQYHNVTAFTLVIKFFIAWSLS